MVQYIPNCEACGQGSFSLERGGEDERGKERGCCWPTGTEGSRRSRQEEHTFLWGCCVGGGGVSMRAALREDEGYATGWQPHRKYITVKLSEDPPKLPPPSCRISPLAHFGIFSAWFVPCDLHYDVMGEAGGSAEDIQNTTGGIIVSDDVSQCVCQGSWRH